MRTLCLLVLFTPFSLSFYFRYLLFFTITLPVFVQATVFRLLKYETLFLLTSVVTSLRV